MNNKWYELERKGWSWSTGWSPTIYSGYYAQAWRPFKQRRWVDGKWVYRECFTEGGKTIAEAESNLWQRLDQLENKQ